MANIKLKSSEISLIKAYCSRASDNDLLLLSETLPQSVMGDRAAACDVLQADKEIDRWLSHASSAEEWFCKADAIGEFAVLEILSRSKKSES